MKRQELWRQQYREKRYMSHLDDDELRQRAKDVCLNILVLTDQTKIGLLPIANTDDYWIELWTQVLEEFKIRFGPYPAGFTNGFIKDVAIPDPSSPLASKAAAAIQQHLLSGHYLVKYGKNRHLGDTLKSGALRISPASFYKDPSLNPAVRDDELQLSVQPHPSQCRIKAVSHKTGQPIFAPEHVRKFTYTEKSRTDYYVYCLSSNLAPRLFLDFDADACVVITHPHSFLNRLLAAFKNLFPNWLSNAIPVKYIDPLNTPAGSFDVFSYKHFRYAYQKEFRVIWLPPSPINNLQHVYLELGNLQDCCQLISL